MFAAWTNLDPGIEEHEEVVGADAEHLELNVLCQYI